ncbi:transformation/transcription domain-associated protein-like isoform X2 [Sycon ciliatum]|uniref:transformation/transcription domain-associated protein-like isoform X2 n=1 Tax=Sycon ciliatum TaxID=27933 RepID=UPI0031F62247
MIRVIAELSGKDTVDVISPHKELLSQKVPPAKFQLRNQPLRAQIGLLDGNTFCLNLRPRIFFIDMDNTAHQTFIKELKHLCEDDDATLRKNPCYKTGTSLVEVRIAALRALASCADVPQLTASVFTILLQAFAGGSKEMQAMQQVAVTLMQEYIGKYAYDIEQVQMHAQPIMLKVSDNRSSNLQIINRLRWITHVFPKVFTDSFCELMLNNLKKWLEIACFHSSKQFQQEIAFRAQSHAQQQQSKESLANNRRSIESNVESELRCCHAFVMLLSECRQMPQKMLEHLLSMLLAGIAKTRSVHVPGLLIEPLFTLLERFKAMVQNYFVANLHDMVVSRTFLHLLQHEKGIELRTFVEGNVAPILQHLTVKAEDRPSLDLRSAHALAVRIIRVVGRANEKWLSTQHKLIASLRGMWDQPSVQSLLQKRCEFVACDRWVEPKRIAKCILQYVKYNPGLVEALFPLLRAVESRSIVSYHFISSFIDEVIVQGYTVEQRRDTYFKFHRVYHDSKYSMDVKCSILQHIIIPMFHYSFHNGVVDELLGGQPDPDGDDEKNIVHQFLLHVMFQEGLPAPSESMTIFLQQFATLLIQYAPQHIHDTNTKVKHGSKLKTLMSLAWPCLGNRVAVDPIAKFNGHMLFANCFLQFAVHKKIPLQMFHCLLQANGVEGRGTVKKVIDVLTPALPVRIDDGRSLMVHWTKQVLVEEGHSAQQLVHVLNVICRHHVSYFPARHSLVQHLLTGALRLAFGPAEKNRFNEYKATLENRRIALETIETVYNWERLHIDAVEAEAAAAEAPMATGGDREASTETSSDVATAVPARRPSEGAASEAKKAKPSEPSEGGFEKKFSDQLVNFLIRLSCLAGDATTATGGSSRDGASSSSTASSSNSASAAGGLSASLPSSGGSHMIMQLSSSSAITPAEFARRTHALLSKCLKPSFWQDAVISMQPIEHAFSSMADTVSSVLNVCSALEVVTLLLDALPRVQVLAHFKAISAGVISCMSSTNNKIVKSTQQLMARLTTLFPIEPLTTGAASKYEELEELYTKVSVVVTEGFGRYDRLRDEEVARAASTPPSARPESRNVSTVQMHATLQLLKAVCSSSNVYVDRFIPVVIRVLGRMQKDHIDPAKATDTTLPEQIGVAIDLLKLRLVVMNPEQRKQYLQCVATLIEKSPDIKLVRSISTIVEEWISTKSSGQSPTAREKGLLLSRLMACQEKRFSADTEFVSQFLDLVALVYRSETSSSGSELASKLEPAFLAGLRSTQPQIRSRFFELFNQTIPSRLYERLFYILCTQDWSAMGSHFWIKQCVELVLSTAHKDKFAVLVSDALKLPAAGMSNVFVPSGCRITPLGSPLVKHDTAMDTEDKKPATVQSRKSTKTLSVPPAQDVPRAAAKQDHGEVPMDTDGGSSQDPSSTVCVESLESLVDKHAVFIDNMKQLKSQALLVPMTHLCHASTELARRTWLELMPDVWSALSDEQRGVLSSEVGSFLASGSHTSQTDAHPSVLQVFMEAFSKCRPPISIPPQILSYIGKHNNAYHQAALFLESAVLSQQFISRQLQSTAQEQTRRNPHAAEGLEYLSQLQDVREHTLEALSEMYETLSEKDLWSALWQKTCRYPETQQAMAYQQQGCYEQAQGIYEKMASKAQEDFATKPASPLHTCELKLWENQWIKCSKELGLWSLLLKLGQASKAEDHPYIVMESAWRHPDWLAFKESLAMVERCCPDYLCPRYNTYRGILAIGHNEENSHTKVDRLVETSFHQISNLWRNLPHIVSLQHVPLLQQMQLVYELQEANQLQICVEQIQASTNRSNTSLHDVKNFTKLWRQRQPNIWDDMSHWSDVIIFRQHQYRMLQTAFDTFSANQQPADRSVSTSTQLLGVHGTASSIIHFAKVCRRQGLFNSCLDNLARIHTIPNVPIVDCYQKIRQQIKCYLQMAGNAGVTELNEGLETVETTNLKFFSKDMSAEFLALKASFLAKLDRVEEANKWFSAAVAMNDSAAKPWSCWAEFLDQSFVKDHQNMETGVNAITAYLHACRSQSELKCRKLLSRIFWLMAYDKDMMFAEVLEKHGTLVTPQCWLPWLSQLFTLVINLDTSPQTQTVKNKGTYVYCLMVHIGRAFPQAMYFPLRSYYLSLKEDRRKILEKPGVSGLLNAQATPKKPTGSSILTSTHTNPQDGNAAASSSSTTAHDVTNARDLSSSSQASSSTSVGGGEAMDTTGSAVVGSRRETCTVGEATSKSGGSTSDSPRPRQRAASETSSASAPAAVSATPDTAAGDGGEEAMDTSGSAPPQDDTVPAPSPLTSTHPPTTASSTSSASATAAAPISSSPSLPAAGRSSRTSSASRSTRAPSTAGSASSSSAAAAAGTSSPSGADRAQVVAAGAGWRATQSMVICSKIMVNLREMNPVLLGCMEQVIEQMYQLHLSDDWLSDMTSCMKACLTVCNREAFQNRHNVSGCTVSQRVLAVVKTLVDKFTLGFQHKSPPPPTTAAASTSSSSSSATSGLTAANTSSSNTHIGGGQQQQQRQPTAAKCPAAASLGRYQDFDSYLQTFTDDFNISAETRLPGVVTKLKKWIRLLDRTWKLTDKRKMIDSRFILHFTLANAEVMLPSENLLHRMQTNGFHIARFLPHMETVVKDDGFAKRIQIQATNGKIYPYLLLGDVETHDCWREERVLQLFKIANTMLQKRKEPAIRLLQYNISKITNVAPNVRLMEDDPSDISFLSILEEACQQEQISSPDKAVEMYYDRLALEQIKHATSHSNGVPTHTLASIFNEIIRDVIPSTVLRKWSINIFQSAVDFWHFRAQVARHLAIYFVAEYVLHLTEMTPRKLYLTRNTGCLSARFYRFDVDKQTGSLLNEDRVAPFRLTPNILSLLAPLNLEGPLSAAMVATARCLADPSFALPNYLYTILKDEFILWHRKRYFTQDDFSAGLPEISATDELVPLVSTAVTDMMARLHELAQYDDGVNRADSLLEQASNVGVLSQLDPATFPWF